MSFPSDLEIAQNAPIKHIKDIADKIGISSDDLQYYGSGLFKEQNVISEEIFWHGKAQSGIMNLPPLAGLVFKMVR